MSDLPSDHPPVRLTKEELHATTPRREQFGTDDEFEEALSRWMSRQGRSALLQPPRTADTVIDDQPTEAAKALAQILLRSLATNPELAAKQERLLRKLAERDTPSGDGAADR